MSRIRAKHVSGGSLMYSIAENIRAVAIRHAQELAKPDYPTMERITELAKKLGAPLVQVEDGNIWEFADKSKLMFQRDKLSILED